MPRALLHEFGVISRCDPRAVSVPESGSSRSLRIGHFANGAGVRHTPDAVFVFPRYDSPYLEQLPGIRQLHLGRRGPDPRQLQAGEVPGRHSAAHRPAADRLRSGADEGEGPPSQCEAEREARQDCWTWGRNSGNRRSRRRKSGPFERPARKSRN
jgi:hypothetical protein